MRLAKKASRSVSISTYWDQKDVQRAQSESEISLFWEKYVRPLGNQKTTSCKRSKSELPGNLRRDSGNSSLCSESARVSLESSTTAEISNTSLASNNSDSSTLSKTHSENSATRDTLATIITIRPEQNKIVHEYLSDSKQNKSRGISIARSHTLPLSLLSHMPSKSRLKINTA